MAAHGATHQTDERVTHRWSSAPQVRNLGLVHARVPQEDGAMAPADAIEAGCGT
jgi:hypothetical protein